MILVGGQAFGNVAGAKENLVLKLLEHPVLVASANSLKGTEVLEVHPPYPSGNEEQNADMGGSDARKNLKYVYVFQKEYATASSLFAEMVGTDEITTCIGLVLRDPLSGLTSVGHFDSAESVTAGVNQMIATVAAISYNAIQVHMVGAFDDSSEHVDQMTSMMQSSEGLSSKDDPGRRLGWSWPLAVMMVDALQNSEHSFDVETCCILQHNTTTGPSGHACPKVGGFMVETSSGQITPARFLPEARCPDGLVRGVCTTTVSTDSNRIPALMAPYDTASDKFVISPIKWIHTFQKYATHMLSLSDAAFLETFSTSPHAEGPDFIPTSRSIFQYMQAFPYWQQTFPNGEPRVFTRTNTGGWIREQDYS